MRGASRKLVGKARTSDALLAEIAFRACALRMSIPYTFD
jgi:hypothetical protein